MIDNISGFGLIAIDKAGGRLLFLDPATLDICSTIQDVPRKPHELLILPDLNKAYVPIFGDGIHGDNPNPGHQIAVVDLQRQAIDKLIDLSPLKAPHTARRAVNGMIYCCCEASGAVAVINPETDTVTGVIRLDSRKVHRLAALPGKARVVTESEEDATLNLIDVHARGGAVIAECKMPGPLNGVDAAPTRPWIVCTDGKQPRLFVVNRNDLALIREITLTGHTKQGQIVRYRPDGEVLAVIGDFDPVASFYDADLNFLFAAQVGDKPLDGAFSPDGSTFLVANEKSGSVTVIDIERRAVKATISVPVGVEVLGYYPL